MRYRMKLNMSTYLEHECISILTMKTDIDYKRTFIHNALSARVLFRIYILQWSFIESSWLFNRFYKEKQNIRIVERFCSKMLTIEVHSSWLPIRIGRSSAGTFRAVPDTVKKVPGLAPVLFTNAKQITFLTSHISLFAFILMFLFPPFSFP